MFTLPSNGSRLSHNLKVLLFRAKKDLFSRITDQVALPLITDRVLASYHG
jgi:hypothetical protein